MTTIPQQQLFERFDSLPLSLREAIFDEPTTDFIWKTSEDEHIPDEQIYTISKLVGYVLMGFLHPEDLTDEIKDGLNIDPRIASAIQDDLNKRIFAPLRPDLDRVYKPLGKTEISSSGPIILNDIDTAPSAPKTVTAPLPQPQSQPISISTATSQTLNAAPTINGAALANNNIPPTAPKINRLSDVGWSRSRSADPVVKLDITPAPNSAPQPQPQLRSQITPSQIPVAPANHTLGEFERLNAMKKPATAPSPIAASVPAPTTAEPAPFMLHQDTSAHAQDKNSTFVLPKPGTDAHIQMNAVKVPVPVRPAVLEFGTSNVPAPKSAPVNGPSKAIHYTQFSASLSSVPTVNTGPRKISEVGPAPIIPKPAAAPTVPMATIPVPRPLQAPAPTQNQASGPKEKVIVKDFL